MRNLFRTTVAAIFGPARTRKVRKTTRRVGLNIENLGERVLLSGSPFFHNIGVQPPIAPIGFQPPITIVHPIPLPIRFVDVPNLKGYTFNLNSTNGKPAHTLVINSETYNWNGSASFTGTWKGDGPNSHAVSGSLVFAPNSTAVTNVNFSWTNGNGGQNSFSGSLTRNLVRFSRFSGDYYLTGNVSSPTGGGPGMVSGYGYPPRPVNHFITVR
jgi:hypothetical protein